MAVTGGTLAAATAVTVTLTGFTLGNGTIGGDITVQTSADPLASLPQSSGIIWNQGQSVLTFFTVALSDRVAGRTAAVATFSFTPTLGGALAADSLITLSYPAGFFASGTITAQSSAPGVILTVAPPGASYVKMTVTGGTLAAATAVTVTLTGFTMGSPTAGGDITVQTSADPFSSLPQASGVIGGRPLLSSFNISSSDRVAGRRVTFTLSFTPSAGGALAPGGKITLNYPSNFFCVWQPQHL